MKTEFIYDVFLRHSSKDKALVLCMSANACGSDWAQLESGTFRFRDPLNKDRRFLPLRLDDALAVLLLVFPTTPSKNYKLEARKSASLTGKRNSQHQIQ